MLIGLGVAIQFYPLDRTNPPVGSEIVAPPLVGKILRSSCYDCHSNETRWGWYSYVAPLSWLAVHDVKVARKRFNFSEWEKLTYRRQSELKKEILKKVESGEMPPVYYVRSHPWARLQRHEINILREWIVSGQTYGEER